jgi:spoIIIJ-associated protein
MSDFKEFTGKDVDDAIEQACKHFDAPRNKLELEILSGGSTGIFGLVGVKKATVRARLRQAEPGPGRETKQQAKAAQAKAETPGKPESGRPEAKTPEEPAPKDRQGNGRGKNKPGRQRQQKQQQDRDRRPKEQRSAKDQAPPKDQPPREDQKQNQEAQPKAEREQKPARKEGKPSGRRKNSRRRPKKGPEAESSQPGNNQKQAAKAEERQKPVDATEAREAKDLVLEVVGKLIEPIVTEVELSAEVEPGRVKVQVEDEEHAGLIIGAEGQTISALQYLANRIVARKAKGNVRVHLDAGDYREKQDDSLRQLAWTLADRAKDQGRTQATRPLSSYHRRVVHMALQEDEGIQTKSKGEGPLKRVLIQPRRGRQNG